MPAPTPQRVLRKFKRLHQRYKGSDEPVVFVKFMALETDDYTDPDLVQETTELTAPAIVLDQPDEVLAQTFGGSIAPNQKIFKFLADSFVSRTPIETLSKRALSFIAERTGADRGGIRLGETLYVIEGPPLVRITIGGVSPQYIVLATAQTSPATGLVL